MKELPPLAGWPTQTSFVTTPKAKKRRHARKKHPKAK
jgi:hypothetical protein